MNYKRIILPALLFVFVVSTFVCCGKENLYWDKNEPIMPHIENIANNRT